MRLTRRDEEGRAQLASGNTRIAELLETICRYEEFEEKVGCTVSQMLQCLFADIDAVYTIHFNEDEDKPEVKYIGIEHDCKAYWARDSKTGKYDIWLNGYDGEDYVEVPVHLVGYEYFLTEEEAQQAIAEGSTGE